MALHGQQEKLLEDPAISIARHTTPSDRVKTLRHHSFQVRGPALFNALPFSLRTLSGCSVNTFKNHLDKFLNLVPDTPLSQKYYPIPLDWYSGRPSNSVIDWIKLMGLPTRHPHSLETICEKVSQSSAIRDFEKERYSSDPRLTENLQINHIVDYST